MLVMLEYLPLVAFGIAYWLYDIYIATATLMIGMSVALLAVWKLRGSLPRVNAISTALVLVFGTATLVLRNVEFIQWKPSVFLWALGVAFLASAFVGKQTLAQRLLQPALAGAQRTRRQWQVANTASVLFLAAAGAANLAFAYHASEAAWVRFKLLGLPVAMFVFMMALAWWLQTRAPLEAQQ